MKDGKIIYFESLADCEFYRFQKSKLKKNKFVCRIKSDDVGNWSEFR